MALYNSGSQKQILISLLILTLGCSGCGQKGDLTRPSAVKTEPSTTTPSQKAQEP
jgi:predicted small lipoprotein YifL